MNYLVFLYLQNNISSPSFQAPSGSFAVQCILPIVLSTAVKSWLLMIYLVVFGTPRNPSSLKIYCFLSLFDLLNGHRNLKKCARFLDIWNTRQLITLLICHQGNFVCFPNTEKRHCILHIFWHLGMTSLVITIVFQGTRCLSNVIEIQRWSWHFWSLIFLIEQGLPENSICC